MKLGALSSAGRVSGSVSSIPVVKPGSGGEMWDFVITSSGKSSIVAMKPPGRLAMAWKFFRGVTDEFHKGKARDMSPSSFGVRMPDVDSLGDIPGRRLSSGALQVHSSGGKSIHATAQDGKRNNTFRLSGDGGKWKMAPSMRGRGRSLSKDLVGRVSKRASGGVPATGAHYLAAPLVAPPGGSIGYSVGLAALLGGGIGAAIPAGLNAYDKIRGKEDVQRPSPIAGALAGALAGGGISLASNIMSKNSPAPKFPGTPIIERKSAMSMTPIAAQRMAMMDQGLDPVQRASIARQIEAAASGGSISAQDLSRAGFLAAAAWLASKVLGAGEAIQGISALVGAGAGFASRGVDRGPYGAYGVRLPY